MLIDNSLTIANLLTNYCQFNCTRSRVAALYAITGYKLGCSSCESSVFGGQKWNPALRCYERD